MILFLFFMWVNIAGKVLVKLYCARCERLRHSWFIESLIIIAAVSGKWGLIIIKLENIPPFGAGRRATHPSRRSIPPPLFHSHTGRAKPTRQPAHINPFFHVLTSWYLSARLANIMYSSLYCRTRDAWTHCAWWTHSYWDITPFGKYYCNFSSCLRTYK